MSNYIKGTADEITSEILVDLIKADKENHAKLLAKQGVRYYGGYNDILERDFRVYYVDGVAHIDYNKSNDHIVNNLHAILVDQKVAYTVGKPLTMSIKDDDKQKTFENLIGDTLGDTFMDTIQQWATRASNKGAEELQPYIKRDGSFAYSIVPMEDVIRIKDTQYEDETVRVIRYFTMEFIDGDQVKESTRIEVWDSEKVTFWQEERNAGVSVYYIIEPYTEYLGIEQNPQYHWYTYSTLAPALIDGERIKNPHSWGRIPMVRLSNNADEYTDLRPIKRYIDALDVVSSGFINDLRDIQLAIWVLRGYEGTDLSEFMHNLITFKAIKLAADEHAGAEPKTMEIPSNARVIMMEWLERMIYKQGKGLDLSNISGSSITNVMIQALFYRLEEKSNRLTTKMTLALSEFMYFVVAYINAKHGTDYDYMDISFKFDKAMLFNTTTIVDDLMKVRGLLSDQTILELLPYDVDVNEEIKRVKKQEDEAISSLGGNPFEKIEDDTVIEKVDQE